MPVSLSFWAKLGNETWPDKYHPVVCHLIDVAAVARSLWEEVFRLPLRRWLAGRFGLDEPDCATMAVLLRAVASRHRQGRRCASRVGTTTIYSDAVRRRMAARYSL